MEPAIRLDESLPPYSIHSNGEAFVFNQSALWRSLVLALFGWTVVSCSEDSSGGRPPTADEIPKMQAISGGKVTLGLEIGTLRQDRDLTPFRVTKHPISVRHYRECVAASGCDRPALKAVECRPGVYGAQANLLFGSTFDRTDEDDLPVTCVKPEQAANYCRWIGGKLPDSTQWLAAARGSNVRRFAWGNELTECDQHPEARLPAKKCNRTSISRFRVGAHPAGASPTGIEDVLLTPAELVATSHDPLFAVCGDGANACLAKGLSPGAIDGFAPIYQPPEGSSEVPSIHPYGFRCVLEAK